MFASSICKDQSQTQIMYQRMTLWMLEINVHFKQKKGFSDAYLDLYL